jgi:Homing endonuclease associated repeat/HNH endonuclease
MKFQLKGFHRNISDSDLLDDLKAVAEKLETNKLSSREYNDNGGKFTAGTIAARFGSWNIALEKAGLNLAQQREISKEELFQNLEQVWINMGRQPVFRDMKNAISKYSAYQYVVKFGTWRKGLEAFVEWINSDGAKDKEKEEENVPLTILKTRDTFKHKTKRSPSERLKVQVLKRDGNKCRLCGATLIGDNIHFDHIIPWSKGGETTFENLQILCDKHNLAKGDLE